MILCVPIKLVTLKNCTVFAMGTKLNTTIKAFCCVIQNAIAFLCEHPCISFLKLYLNTCCATLLVDSKLQVITTGTLECSN